VESRSLEIAGESTPPSTWNLKRIFNRALIVARVFLSKRTWACLTLERLYFIWSNAKHANANASRSRIFQVQPSVLRCHDYLLHVSFVYYVNEISADETYAFTTIEVHSIRSWRADLTSSTDLINFEKRFARWRGVRRICASGECDRNFLKLFFETMLTRSMRRTCVATYGEQTR